MYCLKRSKFCALRKNMKSCTPSAVTDLLSERSKCYALEKNKKSVGWALPLIYCLKDQNSALWGITGSQVFQALPLIFGLCCAAVSSWNIGCHKNAFIGYWNNTSHWLSQQYFPLVVETRLSFSCLLHSFPLETKDKDSNGFILCLSLMLIFIGYFIHIGFLVLSIAKICSCLKLVSSVSLRTAVN